MEVNSPIGAKVPIAKTSTCQSLSNSSISDTHTSIDSEFEEDAYFFEQMRFDQLQQAKQSDGVFLDHTTDKFENGLFDETIDATYVINLIDNGRYESAYKQLLEYKPTKEVYILLNQGFKKYNKTKHIVYPADDLNDAFLQIFRHAYNKNYDNILILEDDFIFHKEIKNKIHINNINNFLKEKQDEDFIYYLGCIPFLMLPNLSNLKHFIILLSGGMHSVIYSKKMRQNMMNNYKDIIFNVKSGWICRHRLVAITIAIITRR